ncbi:MAG: GntR family transcriptional regulator, partial [Paracoccus sp. (in: a-proteobacteria)]
MQAIRQQIATGQVLPGDRLPSIRGLAGKRGVSPST